MTNITVVEPDLVYVDEARMALLSERALEAVRRSGLIPPEVWR